MFAEASYSSVHRGTLGGCSCDDSFDVFVTHYRTDCDTACLLHHRAKCSGGLLDFRSPDDGIKQPHISYKYSNCDNRTNREVEGKFRGNLHFPRRST